VFEGDRIIPSSPRQPLSSLKLNCRDSPTAQRKITSTCCKSVECNTACLVHSDKSSRRQSESDSIPSSPQNRRRRNLNKTPNGGDAGTTVGHKTVACDGRKSNNAHGNTRKLSESELKKPSRAVHSPRGACCQKNVANCFVPINSGSESHESNRTVGGGKDKSASVAGSSETISARKGGHGVAHVNPNGGSFEGKRCVSSVSFAASDCATDGKSERSVNRRLPASGGNDGQALVHSSSSHVLSTNLAPRVILQV
jgi:hypothetical protein